MLEIYQSNIKARKLMQESKKNWLDEKKKFLLAKEMFESHSSSSF